MSMNMNMRTKTSRTPAQIASEINDIKEQSGKMLLSSAVEIGRRLTEAKGLLPHGEWTKWLKESVSYTHSTAARLMKTFREYGPLLGEGADREGGSNMAPVQHLGYTQGLILFGVPEEEREQFLKDNDVENMSKRELQQTVSAWEQQKSRAQEAENQAALKQAHPVKAVDKTPYNVGGLIPVLRKVIKPKPVPNVNNNAESTKYDAQFAMHRDNMLGAYWELLKTLVAQDRIDPVMKEINREEALKMVTNMTETLKEYPPPVMTNMIFQTVN